MTQFRFPSNLQAGLAAVLLPVLSANLSGCGTATQSVVKEPQVPAPATRSVDMKLSGSFATKLRISTAGVLVLQETPVSIYTQGPVRSLFFLSATGAMLAKFEGDVGMSLLDFAVHPSGEVTVVLANAKSLCLVRLDSRGALKFMTDFTDSEASHDPEVDLQQSPHDDNSLVPFLMRDAARLAPIGEDVALAIRTGRNAVVTYRLNTSHSRFDTAWRTLVEPGMPISGRFLVTGSYDVLGQLENHLRLMIDADQNGNIAVGVTSGSSADTFHAHESYFHELLPVSPGVLVTRIASDGKRLGTTGVDTREISELHGLRLLGESIAICGRIRTERRADGTGWDAFIALIDTRTGALSTYHPIDVDRGEVLFDMAPAPGGYLAAGTSGYTQNPTGASISEEAQPLVVFLDYQGAVIRRITFPAGTRHNAVRSIVQDGTGWLIGGMQNGPGTHSQDQDPLAITADGFLRSAKADVLK